MSKIIEQLLGSPEDSDLGFLRSDNARKYVKQLPYAPKQDFFQKFPDMSPVAIDLAERMLVFDPAKRITGMTFGVIWYFDILTFKSITN